MIHTHGPWRVRKYTTNSRTDREHVIIQSDTENIARCTGLHAEANAELIAQAPELKQRAEAAEARASSCDALLAEAAQTICDLRDERESLRRQLAEALVRIAELEADMEAEMKVEL